MKSLLLTTALVLFSFSAFGAEDSQPSVAKSGNIALSVVAEMYGSQGDQFASKLLQTAKEESYSADVWAVGVNKSVYTAVVSKSSAKVASSKDPVATVAVYYIGEQSAPAN